MATAPWLDGRAEPITDQVHVMAGLLNRWREYVVDGRPLALGVFPIGDALMCTNPLYGRGCSTAFWSAHLLGEALAANPDDPLAQAQAYDAAVRAELRPWYRATVLQDAEARPCAPPRSSPARTPTGTRPTRARSCAACCATGWCRRCGSTRSCCARSCATSTC